MASSKLLDEVPVCEKRNQRIPAVLQAVFLASNRGEEVHAVPPNGAAFKIFENRHWVFQRSQAVDKGLVPLAKRRDRERELYKKLKNFGKKGLNKRCQADDQNKKPQVVQAPLEIPRACRRGSMSKYTACAEEQEATSSPPAKLPSPSVRTPGTMTQSPQQFVLVMLRARGYSTEVYPALKTAYRNAPTPLQKASYHGNLLEMVRNLDLKRLDAVFSAGISPNPSNDHGESLVHVACRLGQYQALETMFRHGTTVQVCDTMGRTPLHDACWKPDPSFETVDLVARQDLALFRLADALGAVPLSYVRKDQWGVWIDFLYSKRDEYWPRRQARFDGIEVPPLLTQEEPFSRPIRDLPGSLTPKLAELVVSGRMTPTEVRQLMDYGDATSVTASTTSFSSSLSGSFYRMDSDRGTNSVCSSLASKGLNHSEHEDLWATSSCDDDSDISFVGDSSLSNGHLVLMRVIPGIGV